jgi:hypothetical protein
VVESVSGGVPKSEPSRRVVKLGIILVQAQVFGPELEPEVAGQPSRSVVAGLCAGWFRVVEDRASEFAVGGPGSTVEVV